MGKKEEIFTVTWGKNIIFGNRRRGKISYFEQIFTPWGMIHQHQAMHAILVFKVILKICNAYVW